MSTKPTTKKRGLEWFAKCVPLRLTPEERTLFTVLEQTLNVSEYTDLVDVAAVRRASKIRRMLDGILEACHISTGLAVASGHERNIVRSCQVKENGGPVDGATPADDAENLDPVMDEKKRKKKERKTKKRDKTKKYAMRAGNAAGPSSLSDSWCSRDPKDNEFFFQTIFEIGRRNKVLNPSSMRSTYGKLMYLMQDAQNATVAKSLGFSLYKEMLLVGPYLKDNDCTDLLHDERLLSATQHIRDRDAAGKKLAESHIRDQVAKKRAAADALVKEYSSKSSLSVEELRRVIDSLSDGVVSVESNVVPVERVLHHLETCFDPHQEKPQFSLQLRGTSRSSMSSFSHYNRYGFSAYGSSTSEGPTLSHSHPTQYMFVWQSLRLWCKVMTSMHRLWVCADNDLLSTSSSYQLFNTGQGLNRVQHCPSVRKLMSNLLLTTQKEANAPWVGLSVIHLGDRDVPNALIFIDKYTQIPRFLNPLADFISKIPDLCHDERTRQYIESQFGSADNLKMMVLADYFKHGFDGSGDDGGSCIDGRLTSSWNWTSRIAKKPYYHAFMLSGFQGFDGDFK